MTRPINDGEIYFVLQEHSIDTLFAEARCFGFIPPIGPTWEAVEESRKDYVAKKDFLKEKEQNFLNQEFPQDSLENYFTDMIGLDAQKKENPIGLDAPYFSDEEIFEVFGDQVDTERKAAQARADALRPKVCGVLHMNPNGFYEVVADAYIPGRNPEAVFGNQIVISTKKSLDAIIQQARAYEAQVGAAVAFEPRESEMVHGISIEPRTAYRGTLHALNRPLIHALNRPLKYR